MSKKSIYFRSDELENMAILYLRRYKICFVTHAGHHDVLKEVLIKIITFFSPILIIDIDINYK